MERNGPPSAAPTPASDVPSGWWCDGEGSGDANCGNGGYDRDLCDEDDGGGGEGGGSVVMLTAVMVVTIVISAMRMTVVVVRVVVAW